MISVKKDSVPIRSSVRVYMKMWLESKLRRHLIANGYFKARRSNDGNTVIIWRWMAYETDKPIRSLITGVEISGLGTRRVCGYFRSKLVGKLWVWWNGIPDISFRPVMGYHDKGENPKELYPHFFTKPTDPDPNRNRGWICDEKGFRFTS